MTEVQMSTVPLRGYLLKQEGDQRWIQDRQGTWIIDAGDIVSTESWSGVDDPRFTGEPYIFHIRDGAEIAEVHVVSISARNRPLALGDVTNTLEVLGSAVADFSNFSRDSGLLRDAETLAVNGGAPPPPRTVCMLEDHTGWGIVCKKDD